MVVRRVRGVRGSWHCYLPGVRTAGGDRHGLKSQGLLSAALRKQSEAAEGIRWGTWTLGHGQWDSSTLLCDGLEVAMPGGLELEGSSEKPVGRL